MNKITITVTLFLFSLFVNAQVGIGNTDPKAQLDITAGTVPSEKDGLLIPRLDNFPTGVNADQDGMMVFLTGLGTPTKGFYYYDHNAASWVTFKEADNQTIDNLSLTGTTLNLSLEGDGQPVQTLNLASLQDGSGGTLDDAYDFGGAGNGNTIYTISGAPVQIVGNSNLEVEREILVGTNLVHLEDNDTEIGFTPNRIDLLAGGKSFMELRSLTTNPSTLTFNRADNDIDVRFKGTTSEELLFIDASNDRIGINRENPFATLDVNGASYIDGTSGFGTNNAGLKVRNAAFSEAVAIEAAIESFPSSNANFSSILATNIFTGMDVKVNSNETTAFQNYGLNIQNNSGDELRQTGVKVNLQYTNPDFIENYATGVDVILRAEGNIYPTNADPLIGVNSYILGVSNVPKYGVKSVIASIAGGDNIAVYASATGPGDLAGFFVGPTTFGNSPVGNRYRLPIGDGVAGSVMTTDGNGIVTFQPVAGTDNQNLLTPTLTGTTLNLNIEEGVGTSIDLAALQDGTGTDNQTIDTFNFNPTSNILTIEIEDDGLAAQTVNLSVLDTGGDVTGIIAGPGLTGGGTTGALTVNAAANNGLSVNAGADNIQLGGNLLQDTEVLFGANDIRWNLDGEGDFIIQDASSGHWILNSDGDEFIGGGSYWRQDNTAGATTATITSTSDAGTMTLLDNGVNTAVFNANGDSYFNGGKVGIGDATPAGYLDILANNTDTEPNIKVVDLGSSGARINFTNTATTNGNVWTLFGDTDNTVNNNFFNVFHSQLGNVIRLEGDGDIELSGNVGINKNEPVTEFTVEHANDNGSLSGLRIENTEANGSYNTFFTSNVSGDLLIYSRIQGANAIGSFNDTSGIYTATSDRRLKKDFKELYFDWKSFMNLETLTYRYKKDQSNTKHIGLVAQDVQKIYPELINYVAEDDVYQMDYSATGVIAIKAVQELKIKVDQLANENEQLKAQLLKYETLERRLIALERVNNKSLGVTELSNMMKSN